MRHRGQIHGQVLQRVRYAARPARRAGPCTRPARLRTSCRCARRVRAPGSRLRPGGSSRGPLPAGPRHRAGGQLLRPGAPYRPRPDAVRRRRRIRWCRRPGLRPGPVSSGVRARSASPRVRGAHAASGLRCGTPCAASVRPAAAAVRAGAGGRLRSAGRSTGLRARGGFGAPVAPGPYPGAPPMAAPAPAAFPDASREPAPTRVLRGFVVAYGTNASGDFWPLTGGRHVVGGSAAATASTSRCRTRRSPRATRPSSSTAAPARSWSRTRARRTARS